jgi:hypothetical protein
MGTPHKVEVPTTDKAHLGKPTTRAERRGKGAIHKRVLRPGRMP